jgi:hypothetical protein
MPYALKQWEEVKENQEFTQLTQSHEGVWCSVSPVSDDYKATLFNGHGKDKGLKKITVSKLTITNETDRQLSLKSTNTAPDEMARKYGLKSTVMSSKEVAEKLNSSKKMRILNGTVDQVSSVSSMVLGFIPGASLLKTPISFALKIPSVKKFADSFSKQGSFHLQHLHEWTETTKKGKEKRVVKKAGTWVDPLIIPAGKKVEALIYVPSKRMPDAFPLILKDDSKNKITIKAAV